MPATYLIDCTKEIIDQAEPRESRWCIVAIAVRLQIPGAYSVHVTAETINYNIGEVRYVHPLPARIAVILSRFDHTEKRPRPFSFRLDNRLAFTRPVIRRPLAKRGKDKIKRKAPGARRTMRRYVGLRQIVVTKQALF